jgi:amino acid transporter
MTTPDTSLRRSISLPQLVLYGLGTTIGAGIYALTGEVAGAAGYGAPLSFLLASILAGFTALSFAELSGRFPRAAGAAMYVQQGMGSRHLAATVGLLVALAGIVSAAALINAFIDQATALLPVARLPAQVIASLLVVAIAAKGIRESVLVASAITLVEVSGLLLVVYASRDGWLDADLAALTGAGQPLAWQGVFAGALLAFYAFIGFEDMVDVAEEVKQPRRNLPRAILLTLVSVTVLYTLIMAAAVLAVPPQTLAAQKAPLVFLYQHYAGGNGMTLAVIGLLAIINGALVQTVMASRVLYGLASRGQLPSVFSSVNTMTHTPLAATFAAGTALLLLTLAGSLAGLAEATSLLMLCVFALVNLALLRIKTRSAPAQGLQVPIWVPALGLLACAGFILARGLQAASML